MTGISASIVYLFFALAVVLVLAWIVIRFMSGIYTQRVRHGEIKVCSTYSLGSRQQLFVVKFRRSGVRREAELREHLVDRFGRSEHWVDVAVRDDANDPAGTFQTAEVVRLGVAPYRRVVPDGRNRWGEYSGISVDPANEDCFWVFNLYAAPQCSSTASGDGCWGTAWARLCVT